MHAAQSSPLKHKYNPSISGTHIIIIILTHKMKSVNGYVEQVSTWP